MNCPIPGCVKVYSKKGFLSNHLMTCHAWSESDAKRTATTEHAVAMHQQVGAAQMSMPVNGMILERQYQLKVQKLLEYIEQADPKVYLILYDLETNALKDAEIVEMSFLDIASGTQFTTRVKPVRPMDERATAVNHITTEDLASEQSFVDAFPSFLEWLIQCNQDEGT